MFIRNVRAAFFRLSLISQGKFPVALLRNKLMTSGASLGLIPRSSAAESFIKCVGRVLPVISIECVKAAFFGAA